MENTEDSEMNFVEMLYHKHYLKGPIKCKCGNSVFTIQYDIKSQNVHLDAKIPNVDTDTQ